MGRTVKIPAGQVGFIRRPYLALSAAEIADFAVPAFLILFYAIVDIRQQDTAVDQGGQRSLAEISQPGRAAAPGIAGINRSIGLNIKAMPDPTGKARLLRQREGVLFFAPVSRIILLIPLDINPLIG